MPVDGRHLDIVISFRSPRAMTPNIMLRGLHYRKERSPDLYGFTVVSALPGQFILKKQTDNVYFFPASGLRPDRDAVMSVRKF